MLLLIKSRAGWTGEKMQLWHSGHLNSSPGVGAIMRPGRHHERVNPASRLMIYDIIYVFSRWRRTQAIYLRAFKLLVHTEDRLR